MPLTNVFIPFLARQKPFGIYLICFFLLGIIGFLDFVTGYEISFFIFYALPIWLATWYGGRKSGLLFAFICIIGWLIADFMTGHDYSHPLIPYWNAAIRLGFFVMTAIALDNVKEKLRLEELQADFDGLTGLLNGRGFRERAAILFPLLRREQQPYAIAFIDVDNFKHVNDTKGHAEGDLVLKKVAATMRNSLRASDMLSRLGGDEFVILLPRTGAQQTETVLTQLKNALDQTARDAGWPIGFSIGAGIFDSTGTEIENALSAADALMYDVKKSGKGKIVLKDLTLKT